MGIARALDGLPIEMQAAAKEVADRTVCDEGTCSIVQEASISASAVAAGVGGKPWDIKAYDGKRMKSLKSVLTAQYVDNKCKLMSKNMHDELEINVRRIETTYKTSNPKIF